MQISVSHALRCEPYEYFPLTEGALLYSSRPQICVLRRREFIPSFLDHYYFLDVKKLRDEYRLTSFGEQIFSSQTVSEASYVAKIDTQLEFTCSSEIIEAIHKIALPSIHHITSIEGLSDEITGFLVMLQVYKIDSRIDDELLNKGRGGGANIIRLYDQGGQETNVNVTLGDPVIQSGVFDQLRAEIIHVIRTKGALLGIYNNDEKGKSLLREVWEARRILQPKREYDLESTDDHAQTDYIKLYDAILKLNPNMSEIISYIKDVRPAQFGEVPTLVMDAKLGEKEAYNRLIDVHLRSILKNAYYYYQRYGLDIEELFQEGVFGLQAAIPKYNEQEGAAFGAYSAMWVRQNILRRVVSQHGIVYVPVHVMEGILQSKSIILQHTCIECRFDTCSVLNQEIMELLGCNEEIAKKIISLCLPAISLDDIEIDDDIGKAIYSCVLDHELRDARFSVSDNMSEIMFENVSKYELRQEILKALNELSPREALVIKHRYGLDGSPRTLEDIGMELHVTRERIRQIQAKGERRLKRSKQLRNWNEG